MISAKMADRINLQINREMYSAYLYMAMSSVMDDVGYEGVAKWLMIQYHEEMFHAMKFVKYLQEQGAPVKLAAIDKPGVKAGDVKGIFIQVLEHEQFVTASIREIMDLAVAEKDYATVGLTQWYVDEQVEEEKNASDILRRLDLIGGSPQGVFMLNHRELESPANFTAM